MARYSTPARTARVQSIRSLVGGGTLYLAKGAPDLAIPLDIITQHTLAGAPGAVSDGEWLIGQEHIAPDQSAQGSGAPTHIVFADSAGVPIAMYTAAEVELSLTPAPGDSQIEPGRFVVLSSVKVVEGGA